MRNATIGEIRQAIGILQMRDQFAMAALSGLCAQSQINAFSHRSGDTAEKAYRLADAMMEARDAKR